MLVWTDRPRAVLATRAAGVDGDLQALACDSMRSAVSGRFKTHFALCVVRGQKTVRARVSRWALRLNAAPHKKKEAFWTSFFLLTPDRSGYGLSCS
jgi:hypothetical protein